MDAAPLDAALDPTQVADYLEFYGLGELAHTHRMWVVGGPGASDQHNVRASTTGPQQNKPADARIVAQAFCPSSAHSCALLCHGYYDHVGLYGYLIEYLLSRGVAVITFDQLGHGLTSGERVAIGGFDEYVAATDAVLASAKRLGLVAEAPSHWLGQSMGAAVLLEYFQQHKVTQVEGEIVLLAPLVRPYAWPINRWVFALVKLVVAERRRTLGNNADNPDFHALQRNDPLQAHVLPVRWVQAMVNWFERFERYPASPLAPKIIQGYADRTVSWRHNLKVMRQRYPDAAVRILPAARHHLVNEAPELRQQMWDWLDRECTWSASRPAPL